MPKAFRSDEELIEAEADADQQPQTAKRARFDDMGVRSGPRTKHTATETSRAAPAWLPDELVRSALSSCEAALGSCRQLVSIRFILLAPPRPGGLSLIESSAASLHVPAHRRANRRIVGPTNVRTYPARLDG